MYVVILKKTVAGDVEYRPGDIVDIEDKYFNMNTMMCHGVAQSTEEKYKEAIKRIDKYLEEKGIDFSVSKYDVDPRAVPSLGYVYGPLAPMQLNLEDVGKRFFEEIVLPGMQEIGNHHKVKVHAMPMREGKVCDYAVILTKEV